MGFGFGDEGLFGDRGGPGVLGNGIYRQLVQLRPYVLGENFLTFASCHMENKSQVGAEKKTEGRYESFPFPSQLTGTRLSSLHLHDKSPSL